MQDDTQGQEINELSNRIEKLESRLEHLEKESAIRRRVQLLSIGALYAVMAALLILHWAGHLMRHG
tara:strand:+ start:120 stop:317 length:198 start_codon:yes stop_codon:yes gene_type:complete